MTPTAPKIQFFAPGIPAPGGSKQRGCPKKASDEQIAESYSRNQSMKKVAAKGILGPRPQKTGVSWKAGWREIGGNRIYFRSRWEFNYAVYLQFLLENSRILKWEHEPETFWFEGIKRGCVSYLPDFRVTLVEGKTEFHEVKGWMDPKSRTKIKRMKKYHPSVVLRIIDAKWFKANTPKISFLPGWEK